jgi:hypothetical protein
MTDWLWGFCFTCGHCLFRVVNGKRLEICPRCNQTIRYSPFADRNVPWMNDEEFKRGPDVYRMFEIGDRIWPLEELAENVKWCISTMEEYRKHLQQDVDRYREEAPPPVNSETSFTWRKDGDLMHLTLIHPLENGTNEIEIVGTDPDAIFDARRRIEAARWLKQCEEDLAAHMERERQMREHLDAIADIVDKLDYSDKFLGRNLENQAIT